jgi:cell division protein FtsL
MIIAGKKQDEFSQKEKKMNDSRNSVNSVSKIVTAIAIIVTFCAILWAYKLNTKCNQLNDEIVHLKSTIGVLDVKLEDFKNSIDSSSIHDINSDLSEEERLHKKIEELNAFKELRSKELNDLIDTISKVNIKP